jgi:hypothetical protein
MPTTALAHAATVVAVAALGIPFGLLWAALAPDVPVRMTDAGLAYVESQPEQVAAADGWFVLLAVPLGVLAAAGVWLLAPRARGPGGLTAATVGAVGAGLVAWWVGRQVGLAGYEAALATASPGQVLDRPADLRVVGTGGWRLLVTGVPLVPALAAAVTYTLLAAWSRFPTLRPDGSHPVDTLGD